MAFKQTLLATAILSAGLLFNADDANATGIPVYCYNCQEGSSNAAHSILDGIRNQTEALLNAMDYTMRATQKITTVREVATAVAEQKINNSYEMEPSLGAKPRVACGQMGAAALRASSGGTSKAVREVLAKNTSAYNQRNRKLASGEPRRDYAIKQILDTLDDAEEPVEPGVVLLEDQPITEDELVTLKMLVNLLLNPFPVEEPSQADITRIKESGSPKEREDLARSIVMQKRTAAAQYVFDQSIERNRQSLSTSRIKYMVKDIENYLSDEDKALLNGDKISVNQLDELMATYRIRSSKWVAEAMATPSAANSRRDMTLMTAELLNQLWQLNQTNRQIAKQLAMDTTREVSQSGLQSR
ncbi:hypothetical protein EGJ86_19470 [Pseudomonas sp. o96-267]|uniref:hypothetical protein n=1 Tax=Pseudomonas sp. o96-267 TaxID=2479853 RepID=UPI000F796A68|nr:MULTISPECIES: hypothetical protein [Pseudomonas]MDH0959055.1 hypothetical protein [Pseudomonas chengduensis]MDV5863638.1 hypothetical protein [Pseudomonas mendocina]RRV31753.1 hypothetical protein EGJ86_19470 [Pseudomonas sp. o96-267]